MRQNASKVREGFAGVIDRVRHGGERVILQRHGRDAAAIVPLEDLALIEAIEDRLDIQEALRRLRNPKDTTIPYDRLRKQMGLL